MPVELAEASPILARWLAANSELAAALSREDLSKPADVFARAKERRAQHELQKALRVHRRYETARILLRDLAGTPLPEIAAEVADLASSCLQLAVDEFTKEAALDESGAPIPFTVLGMGKLGGRELNYSSDVDVIYVIGTERGPAAMEHFDRVATRVTRALSEVTEDGVCWKVDLDLRPEGKRGPAVNSLRSMEVYYESYGQTWERAAWLKARPVAGDLGLGEKLLRSMEPFVYRRWLDYATLDAIREMKARIDAEAGKLRRVVEPGWNVKLGAGGIRELEFFVQALQLVNAGKRPELRAASTLDALARLSSAALVKKDEGEALARAYEFLRTLEHRLQVRELAQTHSLPEEESELAAIARTMRFDSAKSLLATLQDHRKTVARAFDGLFLEKERKAKAAAGPETALLTDPNLDASRATELVEKLGFFADAASTAEAFARIRRGPARSRQKERAFRYLSRLSPDLFEELAVAPDPDAAVRNLEGFLSKIGARTTLLALLAENPATARLLVRLFGASDHLAATFLARPELIDVLMGSGHQQLVRKRRALRIDARDQVDAGSDFEAKLEAVRRFRIAELLRIGMGDLWGGLSVPSVMRQLSDVADAVLEQCLRIAADGADTSGLVVLALGKLGGREMAYASDVDLVFVCTQTNERFLRIAQRHLSAVSSPTREGIAYRVDTRLRPSGSSGPLVVSLEAFRSYHAESARIWERQAWARARPVAGDLRVWRALRTARNAAVFQETHRVELARSVREMRDAMEKRIGGVEPPKYNLKTGRGGLVDVEFAAQFLQLAHGASVPALRTPNTLAVLTRARSRGLLADEPYVTLRDGYLFLHLLENRLRVVSDLPVDDLDDDDWTSLARRVREGGNLRAEFERVTEAVRAAFDRVLGS